MGSKRVYPAELRARALAEILAGDSIRAVSRRYDIPRATLEGWWLQDRPVDVTHARTRARMIDALYDCSIACFAGVRAIAAQLEDAEWTRTQDAAALAGLVAVVGDRGLRMLGGLRPLDGPEQPALDGDDAHVVDATARPPE